MEDFQTQTRVKQSELTSPKILGYCAEWAVWEGCALEPAIEFAKNDRRIFKSFSGSTKEQVEIFEKVYQQTSCLATCEIQKIKNKKNLKFSNARRPDLANSRDKVDIITDDADIHVKFNDKIRLAGFQRSKKNEPSSMTAMIYDQCIQKFGTKLKNDKGFINKEGFLRRPRGVKGMSKMSQVQLQKANILLEDFQKEREVYRKTFTNLSTNDEFSGQREEFIHLLDDSGIKEAIVHDLKNQMFNDDLRETYYFKFFDNKEEGITLDVHQYDIKDIEVFPSFNESTLFYKVTDSSGQKEYFGVEFRLDGGGHPPQLKVGHSLK